MYTAQGPASQAAWRCPPGGVLWRQVAGIIAICALLAAPVTAQTVVVEMAQGPFDDVRVKRALILAADWHRLAAQGGLRPDGIVYRDGSRDTALEPTRPDLEKARRVLAEAGITSRQPLEFFLLFEARLENTADAAAEALHKVGLNGELQLITPQTRERVLAATRHVTGRQTIEVPYLLLRQEGRPAQPAERMADLVVGSPPDVDFDPQSRSLTVSVRVANRGSAPAGPHLLAFADRSGALRFPPVRIETLGPGESGSFRTGVRVPEEFLGRELLLVAMIDAQNRVRESDEGNNNSEMRAYTLPVPQRFADLIASVLEAGFDPGRQELTVVLSAGNRGEQAAGDHLLTVSDHSGTVSFPPIPLSSLAAGRTQVFERRIIVPEEALGRTLVLQAEIDADGQVTESNEGNNLSDILRYRLPVLEGLPDLAITAMKVRRDEDGGGARVILSVANQGSANSAPTELELEAVAEGAWRRFPVPALSAGELWHAGWSVPLDAAIFGRDLRVTAVVDPDNRVAESLETNNSREQILALPTPLRTWVIVAALAVAVLIVGALALRSQSRGTGPGPSALRIGYRATGDPGVQTVAHGGEPAVTFKLALRPTADPGTQSVWLSGNG